MMLIDFGTFPSLWQWLCRKKPMKIAMVKTPSAPPACSQGSGPGFGAPTAVVWAHGAALGKGRLDLKFNHPRKEKYQQFDIFFQKNGLNQSIFFIWTSRWSIEASNIGYKINFQGVSQINRCQNEGLISPQSMAIELFKGSFGPSLRIRILAILGSYRPKNWILRDVASIIGGLCTENDPKF